MNNESLIPEIIFTLENGKYIFAVKDNTELTAKLLAAVKNKRLDAESLKYAKPALQQKLRDLMNPPAPSVGEIESLKNRFTGGKKDSRIKLPDGYYHPSKVYYAQLPNGDVTFGNLRISNICTDGSNLAYSETYIVLDKNGFIYLDELDTTEMRFLQQKKCAYRKVKNAVAIAAFIQSHRDGVTDVTERRAVFKDVIKII